MKENRNYYYLALLMGLLIVGIQTYFYGLPENMTFGLVMTAATIVITSIVSLLSACLIMPPQEKYYHPQFIQKYRMYTIFYVLLSTASPWLTKFMLSSFGFSTSWTTVRTGSVGMIVIFAIITFIITSTMYIQTLIE